MTSVIVYGIPNCDSCRKALTWLRANGHAFQFHDLRLDGPPEASRIRGWCETLGRETVLNRRSTTFRALETAEQTIADDADAVDLMVRYPLLLKRPLIETGSHVVAGFDPDRLTGLLSQA